VAAAPRGKSTVDGGLRWREWTNGAAEGRGRGGALRRRRFVKEEEMCDGALGCPYVEAKREEGREWGPGSGTWKRRGGGSQLARSGGDEGTSRRLCTGATEAGAVRRCSPARNRGGGGETLPCGPRGHSAEFLTGSNRVNQFRQA
jgi:hypothetical protein